MALCNNVVAEQGDIVAVEDKLACSKSGLVPEHSKSELELGHNKSERVLEHSKFEQVLVQEHSMSEQVLVHSMLGQGQHKQVLELGKLDRKSDDILVGNLQQACSKLV